MTERLPRIGIIGAGTIANAIIDGLRASGLAEVDYILVTEARMARVSDPHHRLYVGDAAQALGREVDLVVEAATPDAFRSFGVAALSRSDFCGFSCTALADAGVMSAMLDAAAASGRRLFVPHGAVLGLDGLADGRSVIEEVVVTTTKSGKSLGVKADAEGVLYEGPARGACARFPRNVNVHAAVALAGIGFDRTVSRIVAVPGQQEMEHRIQVTGPGMAWDLRIASRSLGGVTGSYTPLSAFGSVNRILSQNGILSV